uniref:Farnesyl pyrophosphate synthase n=1 Tax=Globisporangium ultimum (strain ATCC 200006 / CBS 805.95 / DAOM BR144) TaxID=431595 RepID=K3WEV8_GLOUD
MAAQQEREEFIAVCATLKQDMLEIMSKEHEMPQEAIDWVDEVIEYNCNGGKLNRGISVLHCTQALLPAGEAFTPELKRKASILGWCIEWLQAFFLVADDIMDASVLRRGQPCWYRNPKVQMIAINDAFLLETFVFQILKKHFRSESFYLPLVELFHDVIYRTELGQLLDLTSQPQDREPDLARFTLERYRKVVVFKTAYYTFYLSVACAMLLRGVVDEPSHELAKKICVRIGEYFQIQDDFLDCYGDAQVIGKIGTDIQDNKCSWLVVQALQRASGAQKETLKAHYGKDDPAAIAKVKQVYADLGLAAVYHAYEDATYKEITDEIARVDKIPSEVFTMLVSKIFKRNK